MCLIDTHTLIWALFDISKLSESAKNMIQDDDRVFVSIVSLWEIAIKQSTGKLEIQSTIEEISKHCERAQIRILNISVQHLDRVRQLPRIHKDPFDRLIIAQAVEENLILITKDSMIPKYRIGTLW